MSGNKKTRAKKVSHRLAGVDQIIGGPADLPAADLPLLGEVLAKAKQIRNIITGPTTGPGVNVSKVIADQLYEGIVIVYKKANSNLVLVSEKTVKNKIDSAIKEYKELLRSGAAKTSPKVAKFGEKCGKVFDVISCKCKILDCSEAKCDGCDPGAHVNCKCSEDKKIPELELVFVRDQRRRVGNKGHMQMGSLDKKVTSEMQECLDAKADTENNCDDDPVSTPLENEQDDIDDSEPDEVYDDLESDDSDDDFVPPDLARHEHSQNRMTLSNLARECMRWGVSPKAGASIANAALIDANVVTRDNQKNIIDKNKLKRQMTKYQEDIRTNQMNKLKLEPPVGIYFDGKKDDTLTLEKDDRGIWKVVQYNEEHYTLGIEPGGEYLGHLEPDGGKAVEISESMLKYLRDNGIDGGWKVVGSDSTSCITGNIGDVICLLEKSLGRRLLWSICLLHTNELPFRNLFTTLDGPTTGSNSFSGPIGKLLPKVAEMEWISTFKAMSGVPMLEELPEKVFRDLSSDQKYLYLTVQAVISGVIPEQLKCLTCGPICHSRWLTLVSTCSVCYMKKNGLRGKVKKVLETLVHFIVTNYAPMWFMIKSKPHIIFGPRHYFKQIELIKKLPKNVQIIAKENISRSAYHAHPENVLLSMLADDRSEVRSKAVEVITKLRKDSSTPDKGDTSVRKFVVPEINYNCTDYPEMIDFEKEKIYEPNLTAEITLDGLQEIKQKKLTVAKFSNNNQGIERLVKQTSRACARVVGWDSRDGYLRASAKSRALMPKFNSKQDYMNNFE